MSIEIRWAAKLEHVREASLRKSADPEFCGPRLASEGLAPVGVNGRAQVVIIVAEGRFRGVGFGELSVSRMPTA